LICYLLIHLIKVFAFPTGFLEAVREWLWLFETTKQTLEIPNRFEKTSDFQYFFKQYLQTSLERYMTL